MRNRASQKPGTDSSRVDSPLSTVSSHVPWQAAITHAASHAEHHRRQHGGQGDLEGDGQPGHQLLGDVLVADVGAAQIPPEGVPQPVQVLHRQGPVQAQLGAHVRPVLLRGKFNADAEQRIVHRGRRGAMRPSRKAAREMPSSTGMSTSSLRPMYLRIAMIHRLRRQNTNGK